MSRAIVATRIEGSGVPWVNEHGVTGLNVAPGDAQALADGLCALLADPARCEAFGRNGRARYLERFTADTMVEATEALYRSLPMRPGPGQR